jgi:hypothetical protein
MIDAKTVNRIVLIVSHEIFVVEIPLLIVNDLRMKIKSSLEIRL